MESSAIRRIGGSLARLGYDAVRGVAGRGLPLDPGALADPDLMASILSQGVPRSRALPRPLTVTATSIEAPSSNCLNTVFKLTWPEEANEPRRPPSVFVKQSTKHVPTRLFAAMIGFWDIECAFARNLADRVPIPTPEIFAVSQDRTRFVMVMENLHERTNTQMFINKDMIAGVDQSRARRCLSVLARLHAGMANVSAAEREQLLPVELHPHLSPTRSSISRSINRRSVEPCRKSAPEVFTDTHAALYNRALDHGDELAAIWFAEPQTLVHGDSHLGNFFDADGEMGMIDFQGTHWGNGVRDVAYFLINSMQPDVLAEFEGDLLAHYCAERTVQGFSIDPDVAFEQYRGLAFQTWSTAVVSKGLGSFTDSDEVIDTLLRRSTMAIDRVDFDGWLTTKLSSSA